MRILLAEDDPRMRVLVRRGLSEEGHTVTAVADGAEAVRLASATVFDAIVLDVMLPQMNGLEVVRALRTRRCLSPVLMLTARDAHADVVAGLDAGADDYLTKPFSFDVLVARLRALSRRAPAAASGRLSLGDLTLDSGAHSVTRGGVAVSLTPTEFAILECLLRRPAQVVTRAALIERVWGSAREVESNTLDVFIRMLRQKIDPPGHPSIIRTVRGVGYSIEPEARA